MSEFLQKIFGNQEVDDQPFPEVPPHTHDGQNSPLLAPASIDSVQIKSGAIGTLALADDSVSSAKIIDQAILTEHLDALAVTEQKLANAAVATAKIKNGSVTASKLIQTEAVVTLSAQIEDAVIISAHVGTGVIQNAHLGNAIVTNAKIVDGTIQTAKIGDAQITSVKIGSAEVKNANIENLAVSAAKIQDLAVTNAKIGNLAVDDAKIGSVSATKITAGQINLTSTGYLSTPYGGIRIGYLRDIGGTPIYGIQAGPGHGLMLDDGANGYARMWVDTSGNRPLVIDTTINDRIFFKASSGNDILRLYGNNAISGGFVDVQTSFRIGTNEPASPANGEMYYDPSPSGMGSGGRLMIYNGFSWHAVAWFDDI
ncbi:MAG: hypothetical protein WC685_08400 [Methylobacter sp.]|jgi:hypothetical protein